MDETQRDNAVPLTSAQLRELAEAATPGPWEAREHDGLGAIAHPHGWVLEGEDDCARDAADRALIVALRNALPRIIADRELAEACERLEQEQGTTIMQLEGPCMDGTRWRGSRSCLRPPGTRTLSALILALAGRT